MYPSKHTCTGQDMKSAQTRVTPQQLFIDFVWESES